MVQKSGPKIKIYKSKDYNYIFNIETGFFVRWGKTKDDDPQYASFPEILDFEITTICNGPGNIPCPFCYKNNTNNGTYTTFEKAKEVIDRLKDVTQIAFGVDAQGKSNPDMFKIMEYTRSLNIVPNVTIADIDDDTAYKLANLCGAVAVSRYKNKNYCYDSIDKLYKNGLKQINIHILISKETLPWIYETIQDIKNNDSRLKGLNAIVLLSLKKKGRGINHNQLSQEEFNILAQDLLNNNISFGFDSCSAKKYENFVNSSNNEELKDSLIYCEPCESGCFSSYIDTDCNFFPCSFSTNSEGWNEGINVLDYDNFKDIWNHPRVINWRTNLLNNNRACPIYNV